MKRNLFVSIMLVAAVALGCVALSGCEKHTHTWTEWERESFATCMQKGTEKRICVECEEEDFRETELNAENHANWSEWTVTVPATCLSVGTQIRICDCGHSESKDVPVDAEAHTWSEWSERTAPKYAHDGERVRTCSCGAEDVQSIDRLGAAAKGNKALEDKTVRILGIGNSLTDDSLQYIVEVLHDVGFTNVVIGKAWIGASTLADHFNNFSAQAALYTWEFYDDTVGTWTKVGAPCSLQTIFSFCDWDFVSIQNSVDGTRVTEMEEAHLTAMANAIYDSNEDAVPVFYMPPTYSDEEAKKNYGANATAMTQFNLAAGIVQQRVASKDEYMAIIPTLAAIQNFRTAYGFNVTNRDHVHMSYPIGCTISAMAWVKTMIPDADLSKVSMDGIGAMVMEDMVRAVTAAMVRPYGLSTLSTAATGVAGYTAAIGGVNDVSGTWSAAQNQTLIYKSGDAFTKGRIEFDLTPSVNGWSGAVFGLSHNSANFWESGADYYFAGISEHGNAMLVKVNGTGSTIWNVMDQVAIAGYKASETYTIQILFDQESGRIAMSIDGVTVINTQDKNPLTGTEYGFRAEFRSQTVSAFTVTNDNSIVFPELTVYPEIDGYTFVKGAFSEADGAITAVNSPAIIERNEAFSGGTIVYEYKAGMTSDAGFIFGLSNPNNRESYFEESDVSYYIAMINVSGGVGIAAVNRAGSVWTWLTEPMNAVIANFDLNATYTVKVEWNNETGAIKLSVNDELKANYVDDFPLTGTKNGFRAGAAGNTFKVLSVTADKPTEQSSWTDVTTGYTTRAGEATVEAGAITLGQGALVEAADTFNGGAVMYDFKAVTAADTAFIFGINNGGNASYWEDSNVSYYLAMVTGNGGVGIAAVNRNGAVWTWLAEPAAIIPNYSVNDVYSIKVEWNNETNLIRVSVDGRQMASYVDASPLTGTLFGFRSAGAGTVFSNVKYSPVKP